MLIGSSTDPALQASPDDVAYQARNRERGDLPGQLRIRIRDGRLATPWFDYLMLSEDDLSMLIKGSAWRRTAGASHVAHIAVLTMDG
jgi:hypothetical protein